MIDFLQKAFYGEIKNTSLAADGSIGNCIIQIGETCVMISQARGAFSDMRTAFYLYVNDVDRLYQHAIANGAEENFPPQDMDYQDRQAGVVDPAGNYWWISMRLVEDNY